MRVSSLPKMPSMHTQGPLCADKAVSEPQPQERRCGDSFELCHNEVRYLREGAVALKARLDLIDNAQESVVSTMLALYPDKSGLAYVESLIEAQERGCVVMLALDKFAQAFVFKQHSKEERKALQDALQRLVDAGALVAYYGTVGQHLKGGRIGLHLKALVVDSEEAIAGGRNTGDPYFESFSDMDAQFSGATATQIQAEALRCVDASRFMSTRKFSRKDQRARFEGLKQTHPVFEPPKEDPSARFKVVASHILTPKGEINRSDNAVSQVLLDAFRNAREQIYITSNYFNPPPKLKNALVDAALRGVRLTVVSTGYEASKVSKMPYYNAQRHYDEFLNLGACIYETKKEMEHGKAVVVDDNFASLGSYNVDILADNGLTEMLMCSTEFEDVGTIRGMIEETIEERSSKAFSPSMTDGLIPGVLPTLLRRLRRTVASWFQRFY